MAVAVKFAPKIHGTLKPTNLHWLDPATIGWGCETDSADFCAIKSTIESEICPDTQ
jgi:hypothetical protein